MNELVRVIHSPGPDILPVLPFAVYPAVRTKLSDTSMTIAFLATPAHHDLTLLQVLLKNFLSLKLTGDIHLLAGTNTIIHVQ